MGRSVGAGDGGHSCGAIIIFSKLDNLHVPSSKRIGR